MYLLYVINYQITEKLWILALAAAFIPRIKNPAQTKYIQTAITQCH